MTNYKLLGLKINLLAEYELKNKLSEFLNSSKQHQIITINPEFIVAAQKNKKFFNIINQSSLSLIDGSGVIKALQYLKKDVSLDNRITGVRLSEILLDIAESKNKKILFCLLPNSLTSEKKLCDTLKNKFPNLNFEIAYQKNIIEKAKIFAPDILLVGFGAPLQDIWIYDNITKIPSIKIAVGVGGTFDFMSGTIKRAPKIMQSLALEWLFRLMLEPKRIKRISRAVIVFPYLIYKNKKQYG